MGNFYSIDTPPPAVDQALLARFAKLANYSQNKPSSLCVVVHDMAKLFLNGHASSHEGGAPVDVLEIQKTALKNLWQRAETGTATQEDWQKLSDEFSKHDKQANRRLAYQRIGRQSNAFMFTALNCATKALEFGESSDALESLQNALQPGEVTTVRADGFIKTYYKTEEDFLGMERPIRDPGAWVHRDVK